MSSHMTAAWALPAPTVYQTAADNCAYPVASMEADTLAMPAELPPGVNL
ncbi:hypothetical protein [Salinicola avicenniae]|nr:MULTISPECIES: hypothetical protein [unclassified Salinicola]